MFAVYLLILAPATVVPSPGQHPYPLMATIGLVSGVVLQGWWAHIRARHRH